ncbi:MAG: DNA translocase FtsK 4TM domain-containing protein [Deltaproteobacteria bacterium]|nr:DNA translocase FtsK 4TM domain-containing protein [Deltaproteobacteria bacterium]
MSRSYLSDAVLVIVLGFVTLYCIALFSYHPLDPAINSATYPPQAIQNLASQNLAGKVGAQVSGFLLFYTGVGALLLPLPFILMGVRLVRKKLSFTAFLGSLLAPLFLYMGLLHLLALGLTSIQYKGYRISTLGVFGLSLDKTLYSPLGTWGALTLASMFCLIGFILLVQRKVFTK